MCTGGAATPRAGPPVPVEPEPPDGDAALETAELFAALARAPERVEQDEELIFPTEESDPPALALPRAAPEDEPSLGALVSVYPVAHPTGELGFDGVVDEFDGAGGVGVVVVAGVVDSALDEAALDEAVPDEADELGAAAAAVPDEDEDEDELEGSDEAVVAPAAAPEPPAAVVEPPDAVVEPPDAVAEDAVFARAEDPAGAPDTPLLVGAGAAAADAAEPGVDALA